MKELPPVIWRIGRTVIPGASIGTRKTVSPACFAAVGSVRVTATPTSATGAPEVHTLWPSSTQTPSRSTARVRTAARSEPASVSEKSWQAIRSVRNIAATKRPRCSGVPHCAMAGATSCWVTENISVRRGTSNASSSRRKARA